MSDARGKRSAAKASPKSARKRGGKTPSRTTPRTMPRGVRFALWCAAALFALFVLALAAALLVFSPYRRLDVPQLEERHYQTLSRVTSRVSSGAFRRRPVVEARLRLSPTEVNELLEIARRSADFNRDLPPSWSFGISYRPDGSFRFTVPLDAAPGWCFGGKIYADGVFRLEKQDGKLLLEVPELRFGRAGMSVPGGGMFTGRAGEEALKEALPPEFDAAVREFYPEPDGALVLVYRPAALLPLLLKLTR